ncbi:MAG: Mur ligase family protein [Silvanigrellaceae bacterium]
MDIRGKKIWIIGAARSGMAAARIMHSQGAELFVSDSATIGESQKTTLNELGISFEEGTHSLERMIQEAQFVVLSPAITLDSKIALAARQAGIPIFSEIEIASWYLPQSSFVLGITGTNGKSTTTHYAAQLFALGQRNAVACGNYGLPLAEALLAPARFNSFMIELSSYQLETTFSLRPNVTIFLNLQNDHMARYGNMNEYMKAKWRLVTLTKRDGLAIIDHDVFIKALVLGLPLPECRIAVVHGFLEKSPVEGIKMPAKRVEHFALSSPEILARLPVQTYGSLAKLDVDSLAESADIIHIWMTNQSATDNSHRLHIASVDPKGMRIELDIQNPCLSGEHNQFNIASASVAALLDGMHPNIIRAQWNSGTTVYEHLAHRLEVINSSFPLFDSKGVQKDVRAINDSKATNVESTLVAVKSFKKSIRLLLGGEPKGDFYGDLSPYIGEKICRIYPFGKAAPVIQQHLAGFEKFVAPSSAKLFDAAQMALDDAADGDIVLLSPACASFDEFKNFEHRGDAFRHWVLQKRQK